MVKIPEERVVPAKRGPFSRPLRTREIPGKAGLDRRIEATAAERAAIAAEAHLPGVAVLKAEFHIAPRPGDRYSVSGTVEATFTQTCVVTLEPFESTVTVPVAVSFIEPPVRDARSLTLAARAEVEIDIDAEEDEPDPILDGTIDLGAIALEFLMLACDPYPKKPGVHFTDVLIGENDEADPSPFAALERFKDKS